MAKFSKCMLPHPVYHATMDDGRTVRMSVWQKADAPIKGFDWEACRRTVLGISDPQGEMMPAFVVGKYTVMQRATYAESGRRIIAAHIEQSGQVLADDPLEAAAPKKARRAKPDLGKWYEAAAPLFQKAARICDMAGEHDLASRFRSVGNGAHDAYQQAA